MRNFTALALALAAAAWLPRAARAQTTCFDLSASGGIKALSAPIPFSAASRPDTIASGPNPQGGGWGAARAILEMPLKRAFELLRDQTVLKDPKEADLSVKHEERSGLTDFQVVDITIHPFPLISIHWIEEWAYRQLAAQEVLIAYQKVSGTDHLRRFCGNIWLKPDGQNGANKTDFAVYEETDATRRTHEAIAQGHLGTIRTLRARNLKP